MGGGISATLLFAALLLCQTNGARPSLGQGLSSPGNLDKFFEKRRRGALAGYDFKITGKEARHAGTLCLLLHSAVATDSYLPLRTRCATVVEQSPFVTVRDSGGNLLSSDEWYGFIPSLIEAVADLAGFSYSLYLPTGRGPGACNQPEGRRSLANLTGNYGCGQWDTVENRTHMFFALYYANPSRANVTYITQPYLTNTGLSIITVQELAQSFVETAFLFMAPFSPALWTIFFLLIPSSAVIFWFLDEGSASEDFDWVGVAGAMSFKSFKHNILKSWWLTWSSATGANAHSPSSSQGKLFSMFWTFFTLVIVAAYTANLASYMSTDHSTLRIESWDDLRDKNFKACTLDGTAYSAWLTKNEPNIEQYKMHGSTEDFLNALYHGKCSALIYPRVTAEAITGDAGYCKSEDGESRFLVVGEPLDYGNQNMAAMVRQDLWGVADALSKHILDLLDDGTVSFLYDEFMPSSCSAEDTDNTEGQLDIPDMAGLLMLALIFAFALVGWKCYEINPYLKEVLNKGRSLENFLERYMLASQQAIDKFRLIDTDGSGSLSLDEVVDGSGVLHLTPDEARDLFKSLEKDDGGEVQLEDFLAAYETHISGGDEFMVLQQWDSSSDIRTAMYFPVYLFLLHRNRDKAADWRKAYSVIILDDEILDAIKYHQEEMLTGFSISDEATEKGDLDGPSQPSGKSETSYSRKIHLHSDKWDIDKMKKHLTFNEKAAIEHTQKVRRIAKEFIGHRKAMVTHGRRSVAKSIVALRPNGAEKAREKARAILTWCLSVIIDRDERNHGDLRRSFACLEHETEHMKETQKALDGRFNSKPTPLYRVTRFAFRERKLFMLPNRLVEYCAGYIDAASFNTDPQCTKFLTSIKDAKSIADIIGIEGLHEDTHRPLTPEQDDLKHLVLSIFDKYTQMRNDFGHALCGHVNNLFEIEPYDAVKHESWVRFNSCLLEYLLEFRSTAKHEWSLLETCIKRSFESLAHRGHHAIYQRDHSEVTRSDFAWALVVIEHYLTGLPMPVEGPAFRLAALKYVSHAKKLKADYDKRKHDVFQLNNGFDEGAVLHASTEETLHGNSKDNRRRSMMLRVQKFRGKFSQAEISAPLMPLHDEPKNFEAPCRDSTGSCIRTKNADGWTINPMRRVHPNTNTLLTRTGQMRPDREDAHEEEDELYRTYSSVDSEPRDIPIGSNQLAQNAESEEEAISWVHGDLQKHNGSTSKQNEWDWGNVLLEPGFFFN